MEVKFPCLLLHLTARMFQGGKKGKNRYKIIRDTVQQVGKYIEKQCLFKTETRQKYMSKEEESVWVASLMQ